MSQTREEVQAEIAEELGTPRPSPQAARFSTPTSATSRPSTHCLPTTAPWPLSVSCIDGLVGGDIRTGQPAPTGLADYWEIAPDGSTYTFHLNTDAKWHDGVDITADDVQFSFDALANPDVGSAYTAELSRCGRVVAGHRRGHL